MANKINIGQLLIEIGLRDKLSDQLKKINKEIKGLEKELKSLDKSFGKNTKNMDVLAEKQKLLNQVIGKSQDRISKQVAERDKLIQKYNEEKQALDDMVNSNTASTKEIEKQKIAVADRIKQINKLTDGIEKDTRIQDKNIKQLKQVEEQMYRVANGIETYDDKMQRIQKTTSETMQELEHQQKILSMQDKTWKEYNTVVSQVETKLRASQEIYKSTAQEIQKLTQEQQQNIKTKNELIAKYDLENQKLQEITKRYGEGSIEWKNQLAIVEQVNRQKNEAIRVDEEYTRQLEQKNQVLTQSRRDMETYTVEMSKLGNTKIQQNLHKTSNLFTEIGEKTAGASVVGGTFSTGATKIFMDYESGLAKVSTLVDTKVVDMKKVGESIKQISNETGQDISSMMEGAYQALSAGVKVGDLNEFLATSSKLATAGFTDNASAVKLMSQIMNNYGKEAGNAEQIASKLIATQNLGVECCSIA